MDITHDMIVSFRDAMKAFGDTVKWPDEVVEQALCEADTETGSRRWGAYQDVCNNFKRRGMFYFAAHWLSSFYGKSAQNQAGILPDARLNVISKSVGDESIGYRMTSLQKAGEDWLCTTIYGTQFYRLQRRAGMGAMAV
ncbi:MAG: DUF4054 domain-containing protein [Plesiomonas sp.]